MLLRKRKAEEEKRQQRLADDKAKQQKKDESRIEELTEEEAADLKLGTAASRAAKGPLRLRVTAVWSRCAARSVPLRS